MVRLRWLDCVDLGHDFFGELFQVIESLRDGNISERRPQQRHGHSGLFIAFEVVGDLFSGSNDHRRDPRG